MVLEVPWATPLEAIPSSSWNEALATFFQFACHSSHAAAKNPTDDFAIKAQATRPPTEAL